MIDVSGPYTLQIICDDITTIFVDGKRRTAAGTGRWNQMATVKIPASTRAIGIKCKNNGGPYGLMAQVKDSSGKVIYVTDNSWKCSNRPQRGWAAGGFRGRWRPATITRNQKPYLRNIGAWRGMSRNKKVIWTNTGRDRIAYCRKDLRKSAGKDQSLIVKL